jgi:hypothetical protein
MMWAARSLRGRSSFADAFFPVAFLHLGNWENLLWAWEITFVLGVVLACVILVLLVQPKGLLTPKVAIIFGVCLTMLPLCGGTGLLFAPLLALWAGFLGVRAIRTGDELPRTGWILISGAGLSIALTTVYFIGYQRPSWIGPRPNLDQALLVAGQFMAFAFGPAATASWILFMLLDGILLGTAAICIIIKLIRQGGQERLRAFGILIFFVTTLLYAAAFGYGRARVILQIYPGWPTRYVLLAVPQLCAVYLIWLWYAPERLGKLNVALFVITLAVMPLNVVLGKRFYTRYASGGEAVMAELSRGVSSSDLARRQGRFLAHATPKQDLAASIRMLRNAGIRPFNLVREGTDQSVSGSPQPPVDTQREVHDKGAAVNPQARVKLFRYRLPGAAEVQLIWGVDGWHALAPGIGVVAYEENSVTPRTFVRDGIMVTPMSREGDAFVAEVNVPSGASIDYGFLILKRRGLLDITTPVWDGKSEYRASLTGGQTIEVTSDMDLLEWRAWSRHVRNIVASWWKRN